MVSSLLGPQRIFSWLKSADTASISLTMTLNRLNKMTLNKTDVNVSVSLVVSSSSL